MNRVRTSKVIVPIDFSKTALNAVKYAAFMVKPVNGEVILLHVMKKNDMVDIFIPALNIKDPSVITNYISSKLEKIAEDIRTRYGVNVSTETSTGHITSEIVHIAEEKEATMIVMGTHGSDTENGFFLGSNAYRVLTKSDIPVLTMQNAADKNGFSSILLPIDSSHHSRQKVDSAIYIAKKFKAKIHAFGVLHNDQYDKNYEFKMKTILEQVQKLAEKDGVTCDTKIEFCDNRAKTTLDYATQVNADLIVIMSDQNAEFSSVLLGNYAHQLLNDSEVPVLCIKPEVNPDTISNAIGGLEY